MAVKLRGYVAREEGRLTLMNLFNGWYKFNNVIFYQSIPNIKVIIKINDENAKIYWYGKENHKIFRKLLKRKMARLEIIWIIKIMGTSG
jgi:hypothetical protein